MALLIAYATLVEWVLSHCPPLLTGWLALILTQEFCQCQERVQVAQPTHRIPVRRISKMNNLPETWGSGQQQVVVMEVVLIIIACRAINSPITRFRHISVGSSRRRRLNVKKLLIIVWTEGRTKDLKKKSRWPVHVSYRCFICLRSSLSSVMISGGRGTSHGCTRRAGNSVRSADQFLSLEVAKRLAKLSGIGVFHHHGVVVVRRWNKVIRILLLQILLLPPSSVPIPQERTKGAQLLRGTFGTN